MHIKKKKNKLNMSLFFILIVFLIGSSSLFTSNTKALVKEESGIFNIASFERTQWKWNKAEVVSTESTDNSINPSLAVDLSGNVYVVWADLTDYGSNGSDQDIFYKKLELNSNLWTVTEVVSTESVTAGGSYAPSVAVDTSGSVHVAWEGVDVGGTLNDHQIFYKYWSSSTSSWTPTEVISTESTSQSSNPIIAADAERNVYVVWEDRSDYASSGSDSDIFFKKWSSSSSTWSTTTVVSTNCEYDSTSPSLSVDTSENVHVAWTDYSNSFPEAGADLDVFYRHWNSTTLSWESIELVSLESNRDSSFPSLTVNSSGDIYIAWEELEDYAPDRDIYLKKKDISVPIWTSTEIVSTESTSNSYDPFIVVDSADELHIVWEDYTNYNGAGTDLDIFYKRWDTASSSWTSTDVISLESTLTASDPKIAVDSNGVAQAIWADSTEYEDSGTDIDIVHNFLAGIPSKPELAFIVPNPTETDLIKIDWNNISFASNYYVYRSTSYIWSVEELTPITKVSSSFYLDVMPSEGYYYYAIVAGNNAGNSSHSNCQYVEYKIPHLREFGIISSIILSIAVITIITIKTRKNKLK